MHEIQKKLLSQLDSRGFNGLTLREIGDLIDEKLPQKVKHHLEQLEKKGFIKIDKNNRSYTRINNDSLKDGAFISIPIIGMANCGPATIYADESIQGFLKVSKKLLSKEKNIFALTASGNSLNKASVGTERKNIEDGDYVIVDSEYKSPVDGDYIVSVIDDTANIKKYKKDESNDQIVLLSESTQNYPPIYIHKDDIFTINGKVLQVIKKPKQ